MALETLIDLEAKQAVDRLRVAASVFRATELNVGQATKALEMTEANYRLGAATTPRRARRPGGAHPGRVQPRRGVARARQRARRAALRDGPARARG